MTALLVGSLEAGYGALRVLRDVSLRVDEGEAVIVLGANGAGKTTALRAISGTLSHGGSVRLFGRELGRMSAARRARLGLAHVPQGRGTFVEFSVRENLELGAFFVSNARQIEDDIAYWYDVFPRLAERRRQLAGSLTGVRTLPRSSLGRFAAPSRSLQDGRRIGSAPRRPHGRRSPARPPDRGGEMRRPQRRALSPDSARASVSK